MRRVFVTGVGIVSPSGLGWRPFWHALLAGQGTIGRISRFDASTHSCQIGGQVPDDAYEHIVDPRKLRTTSHASRLALAAVDQALTDARLNLSTYEPTLVGVAVGTALGGWIDGEQQFGVLLERGSKRVNPFLVTGAGNHAPGIEVASAIGAQGAQFTFSSGCPSSLQAIGHAASLIASGTLDICIAGGTESPFSPMVMAALGRTHELSTLNEQPGAASRPFDVAHGGMVLSEGSCLLVLEAEEIAASRTAQPYAEILGASWSCDAKGMYDLDPSGETGGRTVHRLLRSCGLTPGDLDYICAHANGSPAFDRKETSVLTRALGEFAATVPVSSIKGVLGHPFGAAGAFETAATLLAFKNQLIPPTHNLETPSSECALHHVMGDPRPAALRRALVTSYGYGGVNAYLALKKPE